MAAEHEITALRAFAAERREDTRIARKHMEEAAARPWTDENVAAYDRACAWFEACCENERAARSRLITFASAQAVPA